MEMSSAVTIDEASPLFDLSPFTRASEAVSDAKSVLERYHAFSREHGGLLTQAQTALLLGVSRARVGELLGEGKLPYVSFDMRVGDQGDVLKFVAAPVLLEFMTKEKSKGGRPSKARLVLAGLDTK